MKPKTIEIRSCGKTFEMSVRDLTDWHLDQVSVRVRECVLAGGFASPSLLFPQQVDLGGIDGRSIGVLL